MNVAMSRYARRERGASLLTALIFMVIMAMLSVTLASVTNLEERMASNTRDRDLALQAAEAALRDAEVQLATPGFRASVTNLFDATLPNSAAYWENCFHTGVAPCDRILEPNPRAGRDARSLRLDLVSKPPHGEWPGRNGVLADSLHRALYSPSCARPVSAE